MYGFTAESSVARSKVHLSIQIVVHIAYRLQLYSIQYHIMYDNQKKITKDSIYIRTECFKLLFGIGTFESFLAGRGVY